MPLSDYTSQALLNSSFGKTSAFGALGSAPTVHVALFTTAAGKTPGTEANYTGYSRVATAASDWANAASTGDIANAEVLEFDPCTGGSSDVTHFGLYDSASGGNFLGGGALDSTLAISNGITPQFAAGALNVAID